MRLVIGITFLFVVSAVTPMTSKYNGRGTEREQRDGTYEEWIGPYETGEEIVRSHTWNEQGEYTIRAKARDIFDAESDWTYLEVTMPVNQQSSDSLLIRFLERFPNAFPILRQLLGL